MQLKSFTVSNFRSITAAKKVTLTDYSVLVGANNEGKSNILHALAIGLKIIEAFKFSVRRDSLGRIIGTRRSTLGNPNGFGGYNWNRDFPISRQEKASREHCTEISFEFQLDEKEIESFQSDVGTKLNGTLPLLVRLYKEHEDVLIIKQGPGGKALNQKSNKVADFVSRKVSFEYIPAVRTSASAERVISELLSKELARLEVIKEYRDALDKIEEIQKPILESLSKSVSGTISSFLPSVKSIDIRMQPDERLRAMRRAITIEVDDGNNTSLERKGDGIKSLVALALMRYASEVAGNEASSIIAIEEPEAHLHPQAIHELRDVLVGLSKKNQVVLTSHSPLFVNPARLESTIVVQDSKAAVAKDIAEVRQVLGVRLSDNLQSARLVAIVEGDDDSIILTALLKSRYPELREAIECGDLVFDALGGASNLSYKVRTYRNSATLVQCFLDNDNAGIESVKKARAESIIKDSDYNLIIVPGQNESELEDILDAKKYKSDFISEFQVDPTVTPPSARGQKWSTAMEKKFQAHGKLWDDGVEMRVKLWLARYCEEHADDIVIEARFGPVDAFAKSLLRKLELTI